jgi:RNA polymerase sigma-70 factor (ECF subfamily)
VEGRSDVELAAGIAAGDESALAGLFERYGALAYGVALRVLGDPGRAEDAVQDAFLKVWRGAAGFDPARGTLRGWLITSVRNRCIDMLRGRSLHERRELALHPEVRSGEKGPEDEATGSLERAAVRAAVDELSDEQRQTVLLAYFGGFSQPEIAELTGVPLSTVKGRMRLAMDRLATYLKARGVVDV